jgi:hypothetical protein
MALQRTDSLYARICEVSINHDYYLTRWKFKKQGNHLLKRDNKGNDILARQYDINKDLAIVPTDATRNIMRQLKIEMRYTSHGFFLAMPVVEDTGDYKPLRPLAESVKFQFELMAKNRLFINYSELALDGLGEDVISTVPYRKYYYFTNRDGEYPYLNFADPLEQSTVNPTVDVQSNFDQLIGPTSLGLLEINAFVVSGDAGNIVEGGILNVTESAGAWTWPQFELNIKSRNVYWSFLNPDGAEFDRTEVRVPLTSIQTNSLFLDSDSDLQARANPSPENLVWDSSISEYVAQVYLTYELENN